MVKIKTCKNALVRNGAIKASNESGKAVESVSASQLSPSTMSVTAMPLRLAVSQTTSSRLSMPSSTRRVKKSQT